MNLSNKTYDILKFMCQQLIPLLSSMVLLCAAFWGVNWMYAIAFLLTASDMVLGIMLYKASCDYTPPTPEPDITIKVDVDGNVVDILVDESIKGIMNEPKDSDRFICNVERM